MADLETRLRSLANRDDLFPGTPDVAAGIAERIGAGRQGGRIDWRLVAIVAAVVLATIVAAVAAPASRTAIADFFGIEGISIQLTDDAGEDMPGTPVSIGGSLLLGERATLETAGELAPFDVRRPMAAPEPDEVYLNQREGVTAVALLWRATAELPEIGETGVGMLVLEIETVDDTIYLAKRAMNDQTTMTMTMVDGHTAYWVEGGVLVVEPVGGLLLGPDSRRSGNVLIWSDGEVTYRLETALPMEQAVRIAESLAPPGTREPASV